MSTACQLRWQCVLVSTQFESRLLEKKVGGVRWCFVLWKLPRFIYREIYKYMQTVQLKIWIKFSQEN